MLGSVLHLLVVWALGWCGRGDALRQSTSVGYSGVLFGTMTAHAFGLAGNVPDKLALFGQACDSPLATSYPPYPIPLVPLLVCWLRMRYLDASEYIQFFFGRRNYYSANGLRTRTGFRRKRRKQEVPLQAILGIPYLQLFS